MHNNLNAINVYQTMIMSIMSALLSCLMHVLVHIRPKTMTVTNQNCIVC